MRFPQLALTLLVAALPNYGQTKGTLTPETLYARSKASVVTVLTFDANRAPLGQGSGFIVARNRVVTNYHVVAGSTSASIVFEDGSIAVVTAVIAASAPKDLVIVEVETGSRQQLALGNELQLKVGETIFAIGSPKGLSTSLSSGLISAFRQEEGQFLIQITAPIAPGSSGGPVLNNTGQVVGVATSRLKEGSFGFAVGASDVQHLLKAPLALKLQLSDLPADEAPTAAADFGSVQTLFDQKKYDDARASFNLLSDPAKATFEAQTLLCKIEEERKDYRTAIRACDAAIQLRPNIGEPYGWKAYSLFFLSNTEQAEATASKAVELSDEQSFKNLLGLIHYSQEKYSLVPKELSADSKDTFVLTLLTGAAFHNRDYDTFRQLRDKVTALKGTNNGWNLFTEAVAAERDLNWDAALDKYTKCDADSDFIDPICPLGVARTELRQGKYAAAKSDLDKVLSTHPRNADAVAEGVFLNLLVGNFTEADRLHEVMNEIKPPNAEFTDCLYFYGRNQPLLASGHCEAAIRGNENSNTVWSNAGYAALDNANFRTALTYFAKAWKIFYASKEKHTATQELDLWWGSITAEYYSGDKKRAKNLYRALKKSYPEFVTTAALKQLPLVWSDATVKLIDKVSAELK
jgi:tetratricopeptide (TPR) repeat protein